MATNPAAKPLLYKLSPPWRYPILVTIFTCKNPANIPTLYPNLPATGARAVEKSIDRINEGELIGLILMKAPKIAPIIIGITFTGCLPKAPKPTIVNIPAIVGPFKWDCNDNTSIVDKIHSIPILK